MEDQSEKVSQVDSNPIETSPNGNAERPRRKHGPKPRLTQRRSPQQYAESVRQLASPLTSSTTAPGTHFRNVGDFLTSPYSFTSNNRYAPSTHTGTSSNIDGFITIYDFHLDGAVDVLDVKSEEELAMTGCSAYAEDCLGRLVFLSGYQQAQVLNLLGARYGVEREFFRRHLDFDVLDRSPEGFHQPTLPSSCSKVMQLPVTSIGTRQTIPTKLKEAYEEYLRKRRIAMPNLLSESLAKPPNPRKDERVTGESFVRRLCIHDKRYFSIEQAISIYADELAEGWIAVVWSDFGRDLSCETLADLLECHANDVRCLPTIQHLTTARARRSDRDNNDPEGTNEKGSVFQTASALACLWRPDPSDPHDNDQLDALDPFYLLKDVFNFVIAAESQFLVMMRIKLEQELEHSPMSEQKTLILYDLDYNRLCLNRHIRQIKHFLMFVEGRNDSLWPKHRTSASADGAKIGRTQRMLKKDLEVLLEDARLLSSDFDAGMNLLMNSAMTDESQRAIAQAERVAKLTALAFFFIPLSYTSSMFGMNFMEFTDKNGKNKLSIWIWAVTSVLVMIMAYLFLNSTGWATWWATWWNRRSRGRSQKKARHSPASVP